jgi:glycosyltransferase involved in cell wall biosynthesis
MGVPTISVVMPVYNAGAYLGAAVQSVLGQTFGDFELIAVDDGSRDGSRAVLEGFAKRDGRVRVISRPNTGIVGALNDGVEAARAGLIARMDADDVCLPDRFALQLGHMAEHPACVAVGSRILLVDTEGLPIREMCEETTHEEIDGANMRGGGAAMNHPSVMMRAEAVRRVGAYRQELIYAEDLDLWLRLAEVGELYNIPRVLLKYRLHAQSISHARAVEQRRKWKIAVSEAQRRRGLPVVEHPSLAAAKPDPATEAQHHIRWAWWALMAGNVKTARKHAWAGLRRRPVSKETWRLAYCAVRGR